MKTNSLFWAMSWVVAGSLAIVQGCGGDDDDNGGNTGGSSGSGGSSGKGGSSGSSGSAGKGGSSGASGTGGKGGTAGEGGATTGGTGGAAGAPGGAGGEGGSGSSDPARVAACSSYCGPYFANGCDTFSTNTYDDIDDCQSTCEGSDWPIGTPVPENSINCRAGNAALAVGPDQELRCGYASEDSTVCVD